MADQNADAPQEQVNGGAEHDEQPAAVAEPEVQASSEGEQLAQKVEDIKVEDAPSASGEPEIEQVHVPEQIVEQQADQPAEQPSQEPEEAKQDESQVSEEIPKEAAAEQAPEVTEIEPQPVQEGEQVEAA